MSNHEELLLEMELIERLPTQERLKQARRRRALQLKNWTEYDHECEEKTRHAHIYTKHDAPAKATTTKTTIAGHRPQPSIDKGKVSRSVKFHDHIMLLDAVSRKDYDEVKRLLESGVDPNISNEDGLTAIHQVSSLIEIFFFKD
jgi:protein phosphatase 1 regulatory subunit 16A